MRRINPHQRSRRGPIARPFTMLVLLVPLVVGCGESTSGGPPTAVTNSSPSAACAKLTGCNQCFIDQTGQCIAAEACEPRLSADAAICINGLNGCNPTSLGDCLFLGCQGTDATGECQS